MERKVIEARIKWYLEQIYKDLKEYNPEADYLSLTIFDKGGVKTLMADNGSRDSVKPEHYIEMRYSEYNDGKVTYKTCDKYAEFEEVK